MFTKSMFSKFNEVKIPYGFQIYLNKTQQVTSYHQF